jgi:hypothetical protein
MGGMKINKTSSLRLYITSLQSSPSSTYLHSILNHPSTQSFLFAETSYSLSKTSSNFTMPTTNPTRTTLTSKTHGSTSSRTPQEPDPMKGITITTRNHTKPRSKYTSWSSIQDGMNSTEPGPMTGVEFEEDQVGESDSESMKGVTRTTRKQTQPRSKYGSWRSIQDGMNSTKSGPMTGVEFEEEQVMKSDSESDSKGSGGVGSRSSSKTRAKSPHKTHKTHKTPGIAQSKWADPSKQKDVKTSSSKPKTTGDPSTSGLGQSKHSSNSTLTVPNNLRDATKKATEPAKTSSSKPKTTGDPSTSGLGQSKHSSNSTLTVPNNLRRAMSSATEPAKTSSKETSSKKTTGQVESSKPHSGEKRKA